MENETNTPESPEIMPENSSQTVIEASGEQAAEQGETAAPEVEAAPQPVASQVVEIPPNQGEEAAGASPGAQPAQRSWFYRMLHFMFSPETRLGRIMRPFLRWTAAIVGLFALGLLAGYLLLYQPTRQQLVTAVSQVGQQNAEIGRLQAESTGLQNSLVAADQRLQTAQDDLKKAQARNNLLVVIYDVANARTYLAQKNGAKVMDALLQAQAEMQAVQPYLVAAQKALADELNSRLDTVRTTLVRDAQLAQSDLDNLYSALLAANDLLFGGQ